MAILLCYDPVSDGRAKNPMTWLQTAKKQQANYITNDDVEASVIKLFQASAWRL